MATFSMCTKLGFSIHACTGLNMDMHFCRLPPPITSCVGLSLIASWFLQVMRAKIHNSTTCVQSIVDCSNLSKFLWLRKTHGGNIPQEKLGMVWAIHTRLVLCLGFPLVCLLQPWWHPHPCCLATCWRYCDF
jgi:hypothetical protein